MSALWPQGMGRKPQICLREPSRGDIRGCPSDHHGVLRAGRTLTDHLNLWFVTGKTEPQRGTGPSGAVTPPRALSPGQLPCAGNSVSHIDLITGIIWGHLLKIQRPGLNSRLTESDSERPENLRFNRCCRWPVRAGTMGARCLPLQLSSWKFSRNSSREDLGGQYLWAGKCLGTRANKCQP